MEHYLLRKVILFIAIVLLVKTGHASTGNNAKCYSFAMDNSHWIGRSGCCYPIPDFYGKSDFQKVVSLQILYFKECLKPKTTCLVIISLRQQNYLDLIRKRICDCIPSNPGIVDLNTFTLCEEGHSWRIATKPADLEEDPLWKRILICDAYTERVFINSSRFSRKTCSTHGEIVMLKGRIFSSWVVHSDRWLQRLLLNVRRCGQFWCCMEQNFIHRHSFCPNYSVKEKLSGLPIDNKKPLNKPETGKGTASRILWREKINNPSDATYHMKSKRSLLWHRSIYNSSIRDNNSKITVNITTMDNANITSATLINIGNAINKYYLISIIPFGFIGNTLILILMLQKQNRQGRVAVFFSGLAIADNFALIFTLWYWVISMDPGWGQLDYDPCNWMGLTHFACANISVLFLCNISIDRCYAVTRPLNTTNVRNVRKSICVMSAEIVAAWVYNIPMFWIVAYDHKLKTCRMTPKNSTLDVIYMWSLLLVCSLAPFLVVFSCNVIIIHFVRRQKRAIRAMCSNEAGMRRADEHMTVMLLLVSFAFLVLTLPIYTRMAVTLTTNYESDERTYAAYALFYHVSNKMAFTNK